MQEAFLKDLFTKYLVDASSDKDAKGQSLQIYTTMIDYPLSARHRACTTVTSNTHMNALEVLEMLAGKVTIDMMRDVGMDYTFDYHFVKHP